MLSIWNWIQKRSNKNSERINRKAIDRNTDYCKKELETIRSSQEKLENSFAETKDELKAMNSRMDNAEEWVSDLEGRIMEIIQSEQETEGEINIWKQYTRPMG